MRSDTWKGEFWTQKHKMKIFFCVYMDFSLEVFAWMHAAEAGVNLAVDAFNNKDLDNTKQTNK